MRDGMPRAEPTTEWMVQDIAVRCREVLASLERPATSPAHLGNAAMVLRSAADDLVSLVELLEGGRPNGADIENAQQAFGLSFRMDHTPDEG